MRALFDKIPALQALVIYLRYLDGCRLDGLSCGQRDLRGMFRFLCCCREIKGKKS